MVRDGWPLRRTVLIGIGAVGASALVPCRRARAEDEPVPMPLPGEGLAPRNDAGPAQRAVLYEEDAAVRDGRRFAGSTVWSAAREQVGSDLSRPAEMVLRAKVVIPDRDFTLRWSMRRNADKSLPASHTVEMEFDLPGNYQHGEIQSVPGMLVKAGEQVRGTPIAGLSIKVKSGYFLIGLSAVEAESRRNITLLKERTWLDLPIVYTDTQRAILAIEKGGPGERAFGEAFAAWEGRDPLRGDRQ
jgi:hypothetical protein